MRAIGHEVLKAHGDSTSRILPIGQEKNTYIISFDTSFVLNISALVPAIDTIIKSYEVATHYLVEMHHAQTKEVIHSYQVDQVLDLNKIACGSRTQPSVQYELHLTILDQPNIFSVRHAGFDHLLIGAFVLTILIGVPLYKARWSSDETQQSEVMTIGAYQFQPKKLLLSIADARIELTSKEADLLIMLYGAANTTVERTHLLRHVWGDNGDYVGRTLDVFISKLRKKLDQDPNIKIANIRGVGYRLVM